MSPPLREATHLVPGSQIQFSHTRYNLAQLEVYAKEIEVDWSKLSTLPKKNLAE